VPLAARVPQRVDKLKKIHSPCSTGATYFGIANYADMPLYHFQVNRHDGPGVLGREAHELADLTAALVKAHWRARAFLRRYVQCKPEEIRGTFDIEDEDGRPVARIYLSELMRQIT
jgi:hypothetical protein